MTSSNDRYTHGHHESVLRSHQWRTAENSAAYLIDRLRTNDEVLDVGCGPGTITADLARIVAPGRVTGIDVADSVVALAAENHVGAGLDNLTFQRDDVYHLSFADGAFDVVHAHQVLQHLGDPVGALVQMRRVLRHGGTLAVRDADYGGFTWYPASPVLDHWMDLYHQLTRINRAEADGGRHLVAWVRAAGFTDLEVTSSNWTYHRPEQREWWGTLWADRVVQSSFADQCITEGLASREELMEIRQAFLDWAQDDDGLFIVPSVEVLAHP